MFTEPTQVDPCSSTDENGERYFSRVLHGAAVGAAAATHMVGNPSGTERSMGLAHVVGRTVERIVYGMGCGCSRHKKKSPKMNEVRINFAYKISFDVKGFGLHDMSLLNKQHDPKGATSYAVEDSFSLNAPGLKQVPDVFRILFIKDFDDPFYLRLLENMVPAPEPEKKTTPAHKSKLDKPLVMKLVEKLKSDKKKDRSKIIADPEHATPDHTQASHEDEETARKSTNKDKECAKTQATVLEERH
ncbi:unnamed protein product [Nippostrongylus brasiliensis]|uniref:PIPK domain-containing protein n=1 Tax=Nippostrongylus brasiliensis TaxID=27835 RepID=A0A0N4YCT3_NIPBR|nr:unnamed protein product [Nippostrongylus brasiliensis]